MVEPPVASRYDAQHAPVEVVRPGGGQLAADMRSDALDVALQQFDVFKNVMVDSLQDVIGRLVRRPSRDPIGVVDPSVPTARRSATVPAVSKRPMISLILSVCIRFLSCSLESLGASRILSVSVLPVYFTAWESL